MEERQTQIREGAGLEESKLNVEFIDWLRKWSTPLLMVVAVVALGYVLFQRWERAKIAKVDEAFKELDTALSTSNPSPEILKSIADSYDGIRAVPIMARLTAADMYLATARTGIKSGARVGQDGTVPPDDLLSDADRASNLAEAERLYRMVLDRTALSSDQAVHAISAAYGLAAVAESRGELDKAKSYYDQVKELADKNGFPEHVKVAQKRIDGLPALKEKVKLYAQSELPKPPEPPPAPTGIPGLTGATGGTGPVDAASGATGVTGTTGAAAATGEPAPSGAAGASGATTPAPAPTGPATPSGPAAPTGQPAPTGTPPQPAPTGG